MEPTVYSIRRRLLVLLGVAISVATLVQAGISYRVALREVDAISDYHMIQEAYSVRRRVSEPAMPSAKRSPVEGEDISFKLQITPLPVPAPHAGIGDNRQGIGQDVTPVARGFSTRQIDGKPFRVFTVHSRTMLIEVMHDMSVRSRMARQLAFRTVLPILILGPILLLIVLWSIAHALRPLQTSREEIAQREANDLRALRTENVPGELLPFIQEINVLFLRVSDAFTAQQHFVADAAHELRSPLAALRLQVQAMQRATTNEKRHVLAERLLMGIDRATRLVEQMLVLAREEASVSDSACTDLPQVVRLALSDILPQAQARSIDVGADSFGEVPDGQFSIRGSTEALRILVRNVLENAVKYTPPSGTINLLLHRDANQTVLTIEDSGPGIPAEERDRVFERFHRSAENDVEGCGLGLSIVQAIATRYGVSIVLGQSVQLGGLSVILRFQPCPAEVARD